MTRKKPRGTRKAPKVNFRRRDEEFAGLKKDLHPKTRWEYLDMDYIDKLPIEDKKLLSKFIDEYYGASLAPADNPDNWKNDYHSTPELRKECMDRNNARNRDMYTILRTRGMVETTHDDGSERTFDLHGEEEFLYLRSKHENGTELDHHENVLIEFLDKDKEVKVILRKMQEASLEAPSQTEQTQEIQDSQEESQKTSNDQ